MAGTDDMMSEWAPPNPSPRTLMSSFLNEEFCPKPFPDFMAKNGNDGGPPQPKMEEGDPSFNFSNSLLPESNLVGAHKGTSSSHGGGLAGRMAANGFNLPKLDTARIGQPTMVSPSSDVLTIPPGLSPTSLLESPIFLSNSMVQPSPTTGKLLFAQNSSGNHKSVPIPEAPKTEDEIFEDVPEAFAFKPPLDPNSSFLLHSERRVAPSFDQPYSFPNVKVSLQSGNPMQTGSLEAGGVNLQNKQESNLQCEQKDTSDNAKRNQRMSDSFMGSDHSPPPDDQQDCEADQKELSSATAGTPAEDGYNWRKYGQKQVKGSEYPRSYYKCTHPNCQVKKKVERSHEGHITEIIYKGAHNHPKPPPSRRSGVLSSHPFNDQQIDGTEQPGLQASFDGKPTWASTQNNGGQDWRTSDGMEATSPSLVTGELCDPSTTTVQQPQDGTRLSSDAIDASSTMSNDEEEEDRATHGSVSVGCDGEGDETESKRRKLEACAIEMSAASRAVREPRVVVQTTSEVDILDDGYRWRKYGQKVVKGNPNPRSYYKCTNPGCTVRKHVERASHDLKSVITTYEGKHNHDVPAARNSNQSSATSNTSATSAPQTHSLMRRAEPIQDGLVRFESHAPLGAYGLPGREQLGPPSGFSFAMGQMGQPSLTNLAMAGMGPMAPMKMPVLPPVHAYMGVHHQPPEGGFMVPKGEPKEESIPGSGPPLPNGGSVYHQMLSRMPLGPQL